MTQFRFKGGEKMKLKDAFEQEKREANNQTNVGDYALA
jgi:hypothetical protein